VTTAPLGKTVSWEDTVAKDPNEGKKDPNEGKHAKEDPSRADGKVPDGTKIDPREPPPGKHGR
jgi:hypothetical protein